MLVILDATGKARSVENLRLVVYQMPDMRGIECDMSFVEYTVLGRSEKKWINYCPLNIFKVMNPDITISGKE
jgi:hypothetical protein